MAESDEQIVFEMGYNKGFKDGIKSMSDKPSGKWIPVSERLPDTEDKVLCWYEYYHWSKDKILPEYGIGQYIVNEWYGEVSNGLKTRVIAWQPLPKPYKMESEDNNEP